MVSDTAAEDSRDSSRARAAHDDRVVMSLSRFFENSSRNVVLMSKLQGDSALVKAGTDQCLAGSLENRAFCLFFLPQPRLPFFPQTIAQHFFHVGIFRSAMLQ